MMPLNEAPHRKSISERMGDNVGNNYKIVRWLALRRELIFNFQNKIEWRTQAYSDLSGGLKLI